jgi:hypothetical protein
MKVIRVDNYDDEGPRGTQRVIRSGLLLAQAEDLCRKLCNDPNRSDYDWFRVVPDDYKLFVFAP